MLIGFEALTRDLSADDLPAAKLIAKGLLRKHGKAQAITNDEIRKGLMDNYSVKVTDIRVRKIIHAIRIHGVVKCLVATSLGYYISTNAREVQKCIDSLAQRERSINEVREALDKQLMELKSSAVGRQKQFFE